MSNTTLETALKGFKVVRQSRLSLIGNDQLRSVSFGDFEYKVGEWTHRPSHLPQYGPLCVFADLDSAVKFCSHLDLRLWWGELCVFPCLYIPSSEWMIYRKIGELPKHHCELPENTRLAESVMLLGDAIESYKLR